MLSLLQFVARIFRIFTEKESESEVVQKCATITQFIEGVTDNSNLTEDYVKNLKKLLNV